MHARWKRSAAATLAALGLCSLPSITGCKSDLEKSDAQVTADLQKASDQMQAGGSNASDSAVQTLSKTASMKDASPQAQIEAANLLAQAQIGAADQLMRDVRAHEVQIAGLVSAINRLAGQIDLNNVNVAGFRAMEPSAGQKAIDEAIAAAQKGVDGGQWIKGSAPVPALVLVEQRAGELQAKINGYKQEQDQLKQKRAEALKQAETFDRQADATTGSNSVGFYTQGSNARKDAADAETRLAQIDGELAPLQQALAVTQIQRKTLEDAIAASKTQGQQLQSGWQGVQKQIDAIRSVSEAILSGSGGSGASSAPATQPASAGAPSGPPESLNDLATSLQKEIEAARQQRDKALDLLNQALSNYDKASHTAASLSQTLDKKIHESSKVPEVRAWRELQLINAPQGFKLSQAAVQARLARLWTDRYVELAWTNRMASLLSRAMHDVGANVPPGVAPFANAPTTQPAGFMDSLAKVEKDLKAETPDFGTVQSTLDNLASSNPPPIAQQALAAARANLAYAWADSLLQDVINNPPSGESTTAIATLPNLAHAAHLAVVYDWATFAQMQGNQQAYDARVARAKDDTTKLVEANARTLLPTILPPPLALPVTTQPATAPSTEPSAAPTTEPSAAPGATTEPTTAPATAPAPPM